MAPAGVEWRAWCWWAPPFRLGVWRMTRATRETRRGTPPKAASAGHRHYFLQWPELHEPPGHSELNEHFPSGALEHLPLLHLAPPPPQSESNEHFEPDAVAQRPELHFTEPPQSELKLQAPGSLAKASVARSEATSAAVRTSDMGAPW